VQICSTNCTWFHPVIPVKIEVSDEAPMPLSAETSERLKLARPDITVVPIESKGGAAPKRDAGGPKADGSAILGEGLLKGSHEEYEASLQAILKQIGGEAAKGQHNADLLGFVLAGIFWGAISLITPCVFPMIPITVSFFLKQSEKEHHRPIVMASVYSLTIVIVLTLAAAFLLAAFQKLSVNPWMNYFIGGLFIFFALSLFGMYEIELPQSLAQFTSSREGKGGIVGTIFMALTFTIISFACVAPFLGGFGGTAAAERPMWHNLMGGFAFAGTFAAPFFLLALFPSVLRTLPKSGSWLNSVKVVMGFLELAAAFKFFRKAELVQSAGTPTFFTFDLILGLWVAMSVLCGLYLIGLFRLPHDTPEEHVKVPRLVLSVAFLGLALYLTPALFKVNAAGQPQRPVGTIYAWVDAFLLPDSHGGDTEIANTANLEYAIAQARAESKKTGEPKRIFIDFTGVTCDNCKINEKSVFTKPEISRLFAPYLLVKLYTDSVPLDYYAADVRSAPDAIGRSKEDAKLNSSFSNQAFGSIQLPLYVIIEPKLDGTIRTLGIYREARINDETAFAEFLKNPG
jgi:thiol:disulfide interchange protein DsbD